MALAQQAGQTLDLRMNKHVSELSFIYLSNHLSQRQRQKIHYASLRLSYKINDSIHH